MSSPTPGDIGQAFGQQVGAGFQARRDTRALDEILSGDNPHDAIGQILNRVSPEKQGAAIELIQNRAKEIKEKKQSSTLANLLGESSGLDVKALSDLPPDMLIKLLQPKAPPGSTRAQPISPEIQAKISEVLAENKDATAEDLGAALRTAGVPAIHTGEIITGRQKKEDREANAEIVSQKGDEDVIRKMNEEFRTRAKSAEEGIRSKEQLTKLIDTGKLNDPTFASIMSNIPFKLGMRFLSPQTVQYKAGLVEEFKDLQTIFKGQTRTAELVILQNKLADIYLTDTQKRAILKGRIEMLNFDVNFKRAAREVSTKYRGKKLQPLEYEDLVNTRAAELSQAEFGKFLDITNKVFEEAAENRVMQATITGSGKNAKIKFNNPEHRQIFAQIMEESGDDPAVAMERLTKAGYTINGV